MLPTTVVDAWYDARRVVRRRRRPLAALLAGVAVLSGLSAARPPAQPTVRVWVAAHDLEGGRPLAAGDLAARACPRTLAPVGAVAAGTAVVGRLLAAPMRRGELLTDVRLLGEPLLRAAAAPGEVAVPVRVADGGAAVAVLHPGDVVDVLATADDNSGGTSAATTVATGARVLAVPAHDDVGTAGLVVVATTVAEAGALARAAASSRLSFVVRPS